MKSKKALITLIVVLGLLATSLIFLMILVMNNSNNFIFGFDLGSKNMKLVDSYDALNSDINNINFNLYSTDVEIKESENHTLRVEYYSNKDKNDKIKVENNNIIINEESNKTICFGICHNQRRIIVYIPSNYILSFNIVTKSGDIKSTINLNDSKINIKTTSGDINLENTNNISLTTTSGDIKLNTANIANLKTTSGDIRINNINDYININTTSGDIDITNLKITANSNINTTSGDIIINNNISNCYIDFKTRSGSNYIKKSDRKSDVVLNVKTTSGDISVN